MDCYAPNGAGGTMRSLYYDRQGSPRTIMDWSKMFEHEDRRVAKTPLWWGGYVSTVFLGLDNSFGGGPPLIFETMVFYNRSFSNIDLDRYSTEAEAIKGHAKMVSKWLNPFNVIRGLVLHWWERRLW